MQIRTKLLLITLFTVACVIVAGIAMRKSYQRDLLVAELVEANLALSREASGMLALSRDLVMSRTERPQQQWQSRYQNVVAALGSIGPRSQGLEFDADIQAIAERLEVLDELYQRTQTLRGRPQADHPLVQQLLANRLVAEAQLLAEEVYRLGDRIYQLEARWHQELRVQFSMVMAALVLMILLLIAVVLLQIVNPLHRLTRAAKALEKGDFSGKLPGHSRDEIGSLRQAFDQMLVSINETNEILQQRNRELQDSNRELTRLGQMKDEFISVVSHELRTPLTSIFGGLRLLGNPELRADEARAMTLINIATDNSQRLLRLVNDLLDLQKFASGKFELLLQELSVNQLLQQVVREAQGYATLHKVTLLCPAVPDDWQIHADGYRVRQVLDNLISNAVKFSSPGSEVRISAERKETAFRFQVDDDGCGVAQSFRPYIFEKFSQANAADNRTKSGTGLGLNISRNIVEAHGGRIGFESTEGRGATFWFELATITQGPLGNHL